MHLNNHCPGCGGGEGNQSCTIARCSLQHDGVDYCFQCVEYPCKKYEVIDEYDSFITHYNQKADLNKAAETGIDTYNSEQLEKIAILKELLSKYNDGRRKTSLCVAVNLVDLKDIKDIMKMIDDNKELENWVIKEKAAYVVGLFEDVAKEQGIELKLRKKPKIKD